VATPYYRRMPSDVKPISRFSFLSNMEKAEEFEKTFAKYCGVKYRVVEQCRSPY